MARLIVLNGPPGCGKSTIAQLYVDEHPLALNLDVDRVRGLLGQWKQHADDAGPRARAIALAAARVHLAAVLDVVVPQYVGRVEFLEQLERLAAETGAEFHELVLLDDKDSVLRRFAGRTRTSDDPSHREAAEMLTGRPDQLSTMYDNLLAVVRSRPRAKVVRSEEGQPADTYRAVIAALT